MQFVVLQRSTLQHTMHTPAASLQARDHVGQSQRPVRVKWLDGLEPCAEQEALLARALPLVTQLTEDITAAEMSLHERVHGVGEQQLRVRACQTRACQPCTSAVPLLSTGSCLLAPLL